MSLEVGANTCDTKHFSKIIFDGYWSSAYSGLEQVFDIYKSLGNQLNVVLHNGGFFL